MILFYFWLTLFLGLALGCLLGYGMGRTVSLHRDLKKLFRQALEVPDEVKENWCLVNDHNRLQLQMTQLRIAEQRRNAHIAEDYLRQQARERQLTLGSNGGAAHDCCDPVASAS